MNRKTKYLLRGTPKTSPTLTAHNNDLSADMHDEGTDTAVSPEVSRCIQELHGTVIRFYNEDPVPFKHHQPKIFNTLVVKDGLIAGHEGPEATIKFCDKVQFMFEAIAFCVDEIAAKQEMITAELTAMKLSGHLTKLASDAGLASEEYVRDKKGKDRAIKDALERLHETCRGGK